MCFVKDLFWEEEECVIQFHPPLSRYVKNHSWCLHLWKSTREAIPMPPPILVGFVGLGPDDASAFVAERSPAQLIEICNQLLADQN